MEEKRRIPKPDAAFDRFINASSAHLGKEVNGVANGIRLGLKQSELDAWLEYQNQWNEIYLLWGNPNKRTTTVTGSKNAIRMNFKKFSKRLFLRMSGSREINTSDREALNLPRRYQHYRRRGKISEGVLLSLRRGAGGRVYVRCRIEGTEGRPRRHPLADAIEVRYHIGERPATANDCSEQLFSSKALFSIELGPENMGKKVYAFARFVNLSNKANNGSWNTAREEWI